MKNNFQVTVKIKIKTLVRVHGNYASNKESDFSFEFYTSSSEKFGDIIYWAIDIAKKQLKDIAIDWHIIAIDLSNEE